MAENIFKELFCEMKKLKVCTTSAEINFDKYTEPGSYEIFEHMDAGTNRMYLLTVDKSAGEGKLRQTRVYCGQVETRDQTDTGGWGEWEAISGAGGGYTPVRGVDYWTEEDIAAMHAYIDEVILGGEW